MTLVELTDVCKRYAGPVLRDVSLSLAAGEIHGLVGANGAGKSTLCNIIAGIVQSDSGAIRIDGQNISVHTRSQLRNLGVQYVQQELNQVPTLSVADNLFLHALPSRWGVLDQKALDLRARSVLAEVGLQDLAPKTRLSDLGVGTRQLIAIASTLAGKGRVLILDEPTSALSEHESEFLFDRIAAIAATGVCVIYVSHKLNEVLAICDRVSVLRDGQLVANVATKSVNQDDLLSYISGQSQTPKMHFVSHMQSTVALRVTGSARAFKLLSTLELAHGERLGIAGLVGAGRSELLHTIFGSSRVANQGTIEINGQQSPLFRNPQAARLAGIALVSEDRQKDGLLLSQSIANNVNLINPPQQAGFIRKSAFERQASESTSNLEIKCRGMQQTMTELSGGNQQKVVLAKWLVTEPSILLLDEPTRGVDAAARQRIHKAIANLAKQGLGVIWVSSELDELRDNCDRILTVRDGQISGTFDRSNWDQDRITRAMFTETAA